MGSLRAVDDRTLPTAIGRPGPVLVLYTAAWCAPCRRAEAEAEALHARLPRLPMLKAELDEAQDMALAARLTAVPAMVLYRDGGLAAVKIGAWSAGQWGAWLEEQLAPEAGQKAA